MTFAATLIEALQARGQRLEDIASKTGAGYRSVCRWADGTEPMPGYLTKLRSLAVKHLTEARVAELEAAASAAAPPKKESKHGK